MHNHHFTVTKASTRATFRQRGLAASVLATLILLCTWVGDNHFTHASNSAVDERPHISSSSPPIANPVNSSARSVPDPTDGVPNLRPASSLSPSPRPSEPSFVRTPVPSKNASIAIRRIQTYSGVNQRLPPHIPARLLVIDHVEPLALGANSGKTSSAPRRNPVLTANLPLTRLTNATHPAVFVLNLNHRTDRLREFQERWAGTTIEAYRVAARPHSRVGSLRLNGCSLSHLAVILAMERHGWPYVIVLEDDADPTPAWAALLPGILDYVAERDGEFGWINLAPTFVDGPLEPEKRGLLWRVGGGFLVSQGCIYGRVMIGAAHAFLREFAYAGRRGPSIINDAAWGRFRVGLKGSRDLLVPAAVMTTQRPSFSDIDGAKRNYSHLWAQTDRGLVAAAKRHGWPPLRLLD